MHTLFILRLKISLNSVFKEAITAISRLAKNDLLSDSISKGDRNSWSLKIREFHQFMLGFLVPICQKKPSDATIFLPAPVDVDHVALAEIWVQNANHAQ